MVNIKNYTKEVLFDLKGFPFPEGCSHSKILVEYNGKKAPVEFTKDKEHLKDLEGAIFIALGLDCLWIYIDGQPMVVDLDAYVEALQEELKWCLAFQESS